MEINRCRSGCSGDRGGDRAEAAEPPLAGVRDSGNPVGPIPTARPAAFLSRTTAEGSR
ncbi:DUF397 domain-containing protein [Streptomyces sp. Tu 3180]|nr:DUF397 domain-containing protein [Streptomyces sp. Tu 3180]KAF3465146.1 DUF397 domain-containing protein [Streptomyces sp. Tu 3180]